MRKSSKMDRMHVCNTLYNATSPSSRSHLASRISYTDTPASLSAGVYIMPSEERSLFYTEPAEPAGGLRHLCPMHNAAAQC